jgi:hypothetical protein
MQAQAYEGYFENGHFYTAGQTIYIPERRKVFITVFDETKDGNMNEQLTAMDAFINAVRASDEEVPEFERLKLREVEL